LTADPVDLAAIAAAFGHRLHRAGLPVTVEHSARFAASVQLADPQTLPQLYWLARVTLVSHPDQLLAFNTAFDQLFRGVLQLPTGNRGDDAVDLPSALPALPPTGQHAPGSPSPRHHPSEGALITSATPGPIKDEPDTDSAEPSLLAAASVQERLGSRDFATLTEEEVVEIRRLIERLPMVLPLRIGRRTRRANVGRSLDLRATLRQAHRSAGDPLRLVRRRRQPRPRRLVLLADVSGSMEPYARTYLHLLRSAVVALQAEAFVFATRLTRLSRPLAQGSADAAYRQVAAKANDWSGGTRLGACLVEFVEQHGRRGMARGAVIVVVSDGWEIEDPALVGTAMARLKRLAHQIIWVNPRQAAEGYQPLVGGMAAALPFVDTFVSGHSVDALEQVVDAISRA
jgi:uncharacterized protein with von Willebrand factor type A (vWA) domain